MVLVGAGAFGLVWGWQAVLVFRRGPERWYRRFWPVFGPLTGGAVLALFPAPFAVGTYALGVLSGMITHVLTLWLFGRHVRAARA